MRVNIKAAVPSLCGCDKLNPSGSWLDCIAFFNQYRSDIRH
jgi:hypothetical protein